MDSGLRDSILASVRKITGVSIWDGAFDDDLILHINGALMIVWQLGIGEKGFRITGEEETWADFLGGDEHLELVKPYVAMKVRMAFDTPTGSVAEALKGLIDEYEHRLNIQAEFSEGLE